MKIGVIASSGGAVFKQVKKILDTHSAHDHEYFVVVDRQCPIFDFCNLHCIPAKLIIEPDNGCFSNKAKQQFLEWQGVDIVFLFFSRIITNVFFEQFLTVNVHPSLLPEYKGFNAINNALGDKASKLGATLHLVDKNIDGGTILAQTSMPISSEMLSIPQKAHTASYIQKVYLTLLMIDKFEQYVSDTQTTVLSSANSLVATLNSKSLRHALNGKYEKAIKKLQKQEGLEVI